MTGGEISFNCQTSWQGAKSGWFGGSRLARNLSLLPVELAGGENVNKIGLLAAEFD